MPRKSQAALPQGPLVPKDLIFGQTGRQTTLSLTTPSSHALLGTAGTVRVLRDQICPAPKFIVPPTEIHVAPDRGGQPNLEQRSLMCRLRHLSHLLCLLFKAVCAKRP